MAQAKESFRLVIVAGARGKMGETFSRFLGSLPNTQCVGISQNTADPKKNLYAVNVLDSQSSERFISDLPLRHYREIILVYAIGPFFFEKTGRPKYDADRDGIDDDVFSSNFSGFKNLTEPLLKRAKSWGKRKKNVLTLCAFGSISDRFVVPWWQSYSKSKNLLREYIRNQVRGNVRGVFINVGSTEKHGERPFADKRYWLRCYQVAAASLRPLLDTSLFWQEIDIFRPNPNYHSGFFQDHASLKARWLKEMGCSRTKALKKSRMKRN
ncbi:MAG: hypothetical protein J4215_02365 [Candidatus Diapherotrites archaeon]|uniref:Uncharacterized protein n=1 Tax=Candidatus Iainarchaeum sp. TaxID=3101447 RepID=A0A8T4L4G8_9ARCH|nr:hypothetical protein [Candidatus Diapherotrites archaeon]